MNAQIENRSLNNGIAAAIGVLVLLIGTASGNAVVMLAMAAVALAVMAVVHRLRPGLTTWLVMFLAATVAALTAMAVALVR